MPIGDPIIAFDTLESTNKTAAELLRLSKVQHGSVILANEQTAGRGQRGRTWNSQPGEDLTISVVLKPDALRAEEQFILGKVTALAVADVIAALGVAEVRIKWPNDVLVGRRKIAGILIKNEVIGELVQSCVVGIGINANGRDRPEDLVATSIAAETGRSIDLNALLTNLCQALEERYVALLHGSENTDKDYRDLLWTRGRWADLLLDGEPISARPMDVDAYGRLIIEHSEGHVAAYGLDRLRFAPR